jgi:hypothetical protein
VASELKLNFWLEKLIWVFNYILINVMRDVKYRLV